jgi:hypothetical protein
MNGGAAMSAMQKWLIFAAVAYGLGLVVNWQVSPYAALAVPAVGMFGALVWGGRAKKKLIESQARAAEQQRQDQLSPPGQQQSLNNGAQQAGKQTAPSAVASQQSAPAQPPMDPELASALEYIGVIEDMILLEGEQNNLDDEIVEKSLALLARLNRLLPNLAALGDANINHNILRLVRKDLNSTINPFLRLSGEAKRQNRRLLLDGIKDIDSKMTFYTKTIEQKDLMELRTKAELIQQRYRLND